MKTFLIIRKEDSKILDSYQAEEKDDSSANRSWLAAEPVCMHMELPMGLDKDCVVLSIIDGVPAIVEDQALLVEKANKAIEYEAEKQKRIDRNAKRDQIKKLKNKDLSSSEIKAVVETLLQVLDLSDEFVE